MTTIPTIATSLALQQPSSQMFSLTSAQSPYGGCCYSSTVSTPMALDGSLTGRRSRSSQTLCVVKSNPFATCSNTPRLVPRTSIPQPPYTTRIHTMSEETGTQPSANNTTTERALAPSVPTTTATAALVRWAVSDSYVDLPCRWYMHRTQGETVSCSSMEGDEFASAINEESNDLVHTPRELPTYTTDMMSQACRQTAQRVLQPLVKSFFDVAEATANSNDTQMHSVCSLLIARVMDTSGEESATNVIEADAGRTNKINNNDDDDDTVQLPARRCDKVLVEYTTRDGCEEWVWGRVASLDTSHNTNRSNTAVMMQALPNGLVTTPCACESDNIATLNTTLTSPRHTSRPSHSSHTLLQDGTVEELYCHTRRRGVLLWLVHVLFRQLLLRQVQTRTSHLSTCSTSENNMKDKKGDDNAGMCHDESLGLSMYVLLPPTMSSSPKKCESTKSQVHCLLHAALAERQQLVTRSLHVMTHRVPCLRDPHSRTHNSDNDNEAAAEVTAIRIGTRSECLELLRAGLRSYHTLYSTTATKAAMKKNVNDLSACNTIPLPLYIVFHRYRGYKTVTSSSRCGDVTKTKEELCWRYVSSLSVIDLAPLPFIPPTSQHTINVNAGNEFTAEVNACVVDTLTKLPLFMHAESGTGRHYSDMSCAAHAVRREPAMQLLAAHVLGSHHYASSSLTHYVNQEQRHHTVLFGEVVTRHGTHNSSSNNVPVNTETNSTVDAIKAFRDLFTRNDWLVRAPLPPPRHTLPHMTLSLSPTALCEPAVHSPLARPPLAPSSPIHTHTHHNNTGVTSTAAVTPILVPPSPAHPPQPTEQLRQPNEEHAPLSLTLLSSPTAHNGGEDGSTNGDEEEREGHHGSGVSPLSMSSALAATGMAANASSGSRSCERSMTSMSTSATGSSTGTSDASDASHLVRTLNRFVFPDAAMVQQTMSKQGQPLVMSSSSTTSSSTLSSSITRPQKTTTPSASTRDVASAQPTIKPTLPTSHLAEPITTTTTCEDKAQNRGVRLVPAHQQVTRVTVESAKVTTHVTPPQQYGLQTSTSYVHTRPSETRYTTTILSATGSRNAPAPAHLPSTTTTSTSSIHTVNTMNGRSNMNKTSSGVRGTELGMPTMACSLTSTRDMRAATQGSGPRVLPYKTRLVWTEKEAAAIRTTNTRNDVIYTTAMLQGGAGSEKEIHRTHAVGMPRHAPSTQRPDAAVAATVTHTTR